MEHQTEIAYPDSNRVGKFNLLYEVLRDGREAPMLRALFSLCVVLGTEPHESGRGMTYYAASPDLFQPLAEGEEIPQYRLEIAYPDLAFANPEHEQGCAAAGAFKFKAIRNIILRVPPAQVKLTSHVIH